MDEQQARRIIAETFESPFDKGRFTGFVKNLLNCIDEGSFTYRGNYIPDAYKRYIKSLERIGKFSDGENSLDILVITLQKETSLERARTMQRNFVAWYLNGSRGGEMKDAALVAYVSPDQEDWRFSLVKMDYKFEKGKSGKIKVKEEFTPARRWSFLVGANEKSHTAQSRLVNILANDKQAPTLAELENAFDIETVTKEFFLKYRELFLRTKEALDKVVKNDPKVKTDFEAKGVDTVNFSKKLLGQIVFLYFLQKKGWFGVGRDDDWGTGSKQFLRKLFEERVTQASSLRHEERVTQASSLRHEEKVTQASSLRHEERVTQASSLRSLRSLRNPGNHGQDAYATVNFFNDVLEPLFYEALRIDRSHDDGYYSRFNCKIPFLNGGLFDPIGNYDWVHTDINLPNDLFSNTRKTKEGDIGDGILDVFDRYNFTVREDEPLEKEVAIDPELLGKAYEKFNAIRPDNFDEFTKALKSGKKGEENKFNKKFGVYYTPREIVHYMCRQSLINYLYSVTQPSRLKEDHKKDIYDELIYFDPNAPIEKKQRNLPHWNQTGVAYFVTFRLFDSIPKQAAENIKRERDRWLKANKISDPSEVKRLNPQQKIEYYRLFSKRYDELLDNGYGCCVLAKPECKKIVEEALKHFDGERYVLDKYVVMPNHVHVIVIPKENWNLAKITHSWKSFTSNEINDILGGEGQLWMHESFDHIIRSSVHLERIRKYIEDNPKKSKGYHLSRAESEAWQMGHRQDAEPLHADHRQDAEPLHNDHRQDAEPLHNDHRQDACATIKKQDIEDLIEVGELITEHEATALIKQDRIKSGIQKSTEYTALLSDSIRKNAAAIDKWLEEITVCDPAVGSGAFPVGMMNEIVRARSALTNYFNDVEDRTPYRFKRHAIQNCLYGVDIDPGAVEIAKLRLWLSLMVDEEETNRIKPLPNLDYKIVEGDSLIGFPEEWKSPAFEKIEHLKRAFFTETDHDKKTALKSMIDEEIKKRFSDSKRVFGRQINFDFRILFSDVWRARGGFDVVIANPPYVQIQKFSGLAIQKDWEKQKYKTFAKTGDIYCLFYERGWRILREQGVLAFITSNKWMRAAYGKKLREFFSTKTQPLTLIDFSSFQVFETATVDTNVLLFRKQERTGGVKVCLIDNSFTRSASLDAFVRKQQIAMNELSDDSWVICGKAEHEIKKRIEAVGTPLKDWDVVINYGIKTGFNEAFIIDGKKKDELIAADPKSAGIIKPILRGRDIKRYRIDFADKWLIATLPALNLDIDDYPAVRDYLKTFGRKLHQTGEVIGRDEKENVIKSRKKTGNKWFETQDQIAYYKEFAKEKIVWGNLALSAQFALVEQGFYINAPSPLIGGGGRYLLVLLNSTLADFYIHLSGVTRSGGYFEYKPMFVENLPVLKLGSS